MVAVENGAVWRPRPALPAVQEHQLMQTHAPLKRLEAGQAGVRSSAEGLVESKSMADQAPFDHGLTSGPQMTWVGGSPGRQASNGDAAAQ